MSLFDLKTIQTREKPISDDTTRRVDIIRDRFIEFHSQRVGSLLKDIDKLPLQGEIIFIETYKAFNAFTFVLMFIKNFGTIDNLYIGSYSLSARIINSLFNYLQKGRIKKITITVSSTLSYRMPKIKDLCDSIALQNENFNMIYANTHKKITCVSCNAEHYVIEGSGNYNENSSREQYILLNSKKIYDFRKDNLLKNTINDKS